MTSLPGSTSSKNCIIYFQLCRKRTKNPKVAIVPQIFIIRKRGQLMHRGTSCTVCDDSALIWSTYCREGGSWMLGGTVYSICVGGLLFSLTMRTNFK